MGRGSVLLAGIILLLSCVVHAKECGPKGCASGASATGLLQGRQKYLSTQQVVLEDEQTGHKDEQPTQQRTKEPAAPACQDWCADEIQHLKKHGGNLGAVCLPERPGESAPFFNPCGACAQCQAHATACPAGMHAGDPDDGDCYCDNGATGQNCSDHGMGSGNATEAAHQKYEYVGCYGHGLSDRHNYDPPTTVEGVESCREACSNGNYEYFGFECPHSNTVHCECGNSIHGSQLNDSMCLKFNPQSGPHCNGAFEVNGRIGTYAMGAGVIGSVYRVAVAEANGCEECWHTGIHGDCGLLASGEAGCREICEREHGVEGVQDFIASGCKKAEEDHGEGDQEGGRDEGDQARMTCNDPVHGFLDHGVDVTGLLKSCPTDAPIAKADEHCQGAKCVVDPDRATCCGQAALAKLDGLVLNLDFTIPPASGKWNSTTSAHQATIPATAEVAEGYVTFKGEAASVTLATNPHAIPNVTYVITVRVSEHYPEGANLGWVMSQSPDYGWSRALAITDARLGHVGQTPGNFDSGLGTFPLNEWVTLVGTWSQGGACVTYMNGRAGAVRTCRNGAGYDGHHNEALIIGGRGVSDGHHNPKVDVKHVQVYDRLLSPDEVAQLQEFMNDVGHKNIEENEDSWWNWWGHLFR